MDGTRRGAGLNAAPDQLHMPSGIVIDPGNGDIYVSVLGDHKGRPYRSARADGAIEKVASCRAAGAA